MNIETLAQVINNECESYQYLSASRTLRETVELWKEKKNRNYLNKTALTLLNNDPKIAISINSNKLNHI